MEHAIVGTDGRIELPVGIRLAARIQAGQSLPIVMSGGGLTLLVSGIEEVDEDATYTPEFLAGVVEALEDVKQGRGIRHASTDDFLSSLESRTGGQ